MTREFDSPWKDALDEFLEPALELFHPTLHADVDWSAGYETLDAELSEIVREAELGPTVADRLFRVTTTAGSPLRLLVHAEVQSQHDPELPRRMFVYHYRLKDRYAEPPVGLVILGDESRTWRPIGYDYDVYDTSVAFRFRSVKLLDWRDRLDELLTGPNPVGVVIAAHLRSLDTAGQPEERRNAKWQLFRSLFDRGWTPERIRRMFRLIDWFLDLPVELQQQLRVDMHAFEQERKMPYITSNERLAKEEGRAEGLVNGLIDGAEVCLRLKFGSLGQALADELRTRRPGVELVEAVLKAVESARSVDELRAILDNPAS